MQVGTSPEVSSLGVEDVSKLETDLQANPEDMDSRMELLVYFGLKGQEGPFTTQLLWFIRNHPSIETLSMAQSIRSREPLSNEASNQIAAEWEKAVTEHSGSTAVLANAANFIETTNPERALELFRQAAALSPEKHDSYERASALIYAAAEAQLIHPEARFNNIQMSSETGAKLRDQLAALGNPALFSHAGMLLVNLSYAKGADPQFARGIELIQQAIDLDPNNTKWTDALESAKAEPQRQATYETLMHAQPPQQGMVRLGAKVAEASLISRTDPVYPPLALQARIQGVVEFAVTVGPDGKVQDLKLVRGHPIMVEAAKNAVLTYVYHPATVDGKAIPFETQVIVAFRLDGSQ